MRMLFDILTDVARLGSTVLFEGESSTGKVLFGQVAGAFTDARRDAPGRFARAEGGTLFLDEIGDISPALQVRLLRALQEKTYEPLGSTARNP